MSAFLVQEAQKSENKAAWATDLVRQMDLPQGSMLLAAAEFTKYKMQLLLLICGFHCSYTCRLKIKNTEALIKQI